MVRIYIQSINESKKKKKKKIKKVVFPFKGLVVLFLSVRKNRCIYMNRIYKFCYNLSFSRNDFYEFHHLLNMGRKDDPVKNNPSAEEE